MPRHKHADVIIAWANGEKIEKFCGDGWYDDSDTPEWFEDEEYRIKPKIVKKEGWVNVYKANNPEFVAGLSQVLASEEQARAMACFECVATVRIEWEEEV